jgi:hypothetical protein
LEDVAGAPSAELAFTSKNRSKTMTHNRREFIERLGAGAMLAGAPFSPEAIRAFVSPVMPPAADEFDLTWPKRVTGKYRAIFDVPEIDSGYGVWRATIWAKQYAQFLKADPKDCSAVLVMRHHGIALAMQQSFWDTYGIAKTSQVTHPLTEQPTDRNPALLSSTRNEVPAEADDMALDKYIARGGVALACNLAFDDMIALVVKKDAVPADAARKTALAALVPGVLLQPSGVFAALHAQDVGCKYLRAS